MHSNCTLMWISEKKILEINSAFPLLYFSCFFRSRKLVCRFPYFFKNSRINPYPSDIPRDHSRPQRPRSFWPAPRIATSGQVQRHSGLNGFVNTIDWDQSQSDLSDLTVNMRRVTGSPWIADFRCWTWPEVARGRDSWCWPKGARPLGTRMPLKGTQSAGAHAH